ncbi:MAG: TetR/AcrR family transcriptional regulator [Candidatus Methylomirabilales bacterium]
MEAQAAKEANTKEQILQAACRLVHRQGFNHTSVDQILRESGVGKGNFYYYFKSKDELGYAILDRLALWTTQQIGREVFGRDADPLEELFDLFDLLVAMQRETGCVGGCPLGNLALEMSDIHEGFRQRIGEILDSYRGYIVEALAKAQAKGRLARNVQLEGLARFIFAGMEGAVLVAKVRKDVTVLEECLDELKKHVRMYCVE